MTTTGDIFQGPSGSTSCPVVAFRNVFPPDLLAHLHRDFLRVVDSDYEPPGNPASLTFGTYWFEASSAANSLSGRNGIERAIDYLRWNVLPSCMEMSSFAGAEWWFQEQDNEDSPKEFHTDCDIQVHTRKPMRFLFQLRTSGARAPGRPTELGAPIPGLRMLV
ncbi:hypothetical protein CYMTET_45518 [Cymbomonas tetramitiformis]|uniref:Uncharacterized protein n=1 Tax=Cymbomonas tetramitiformis TaxID=36881 RepID=A0AAE0BY32_9CHLO|nr:hypothetical protein CYMTET_45518 [Cymbomonas tetramitiformis]